MARGTGQSVWRREGCSQDLGHRGSAMVRTSPAASSDLISLGQHGTIVQRMRGDHRITLSPGIPRVSERGPVAMLGGDGDTGVGRWGQDSAPAPPAASGPQRPRVPWLGQKEASKGGDPCLDRVPVSGVHVSGLSVSPHPGCAAGLAVTPQQCCPKTKQDRAPSYRVAGWTGLSTGSSQRSRQPGTTGSDQEHTPLRWALSGALPPRGVCL